MSFKPPIALGCSAKCLNVKMFVWSSVNRDGSKSNVVPVTAVLHWVFNLLLKFNISLMAAEWFLIIGPKDVCGGKRGQIGSARTRNISWWIQVFVISLLHLHGEMTVFQLILVGDMQLSPINTAPLFFAHCKVSLKYVQPEKTRLKAKTTVLYAVHVLHSPKKN